MKHIKVDVRSKDCLYITIGKWVIYIDNSTGEQIIDSWEERKEVEKMTIDREKFFVNIGHWMKLTRNHFNPKHTQSKIGSELNVTFQQVQKYEKAINEISLWNFIKLCDFLKEDINNVVNACKVDGYFNVKSTRVPMCKDEEYRNAGITEDQGQPKK